MAFWNRSLEAVKVDRNRSFANEVDMAFVGIVGVSEGRLKDADVLRGNPSEETATKCCCLKL